MKSNKFDKSFESIIKSISANNETLLPESAINKMMKFYVIERIDNCNVERFGDILVYEGAHRSLSGKDEFQIDISRQILVHEFEPHQLKVVFSYPLDKENMTITSDNITCDNPGKCFDFNNSVKESITYRKYALKQAERVDIVYF